MAARRTKQEMMLAQMQNDATSFLYNTMCNMGEKTELRVKCATELIDIITGSEKTSDGRIEIILGDAAPFAK